MNKPMKFLFWPYSRKKLLFRAISAVVAIRVGLWLLSYKRLTAWLSDDKPLTREQQTDWITIREIAAMVRFVSRSVPQATCLTQALAVQWLLRRVGQTSQLNFGVDKVDDRGLSAHAWIEIDGKIVIGLVRDIRRYSVLAQGSERPV